MLTESGAPTIVLGASVSQHKQNVAMLRGQILALIAPERREFDVGTIHTLPEDVGDAQDGNSVVAVG